MKQTISLDFDGVLHAYSRGWDDGSCYDTPVPGALAACEELAGEYRLVVSTCREIAPVRVWLREHGFAVPDLIDDVTNAKPIAVLYIDDRGLRFTGNWAETAEVARILLHGGER